MSARVKINVFASALSGILSFTGSGLIVYMALSSKRRKQHEQRTRNNSLRGGGGSSSSLGTYYRIMLFMSLFDMAFSFWCALATLPVPPWTGVVGGIGNQATCTAQGFFVQYVWVVFFVFATVLRTRNVLEFLFSVLPGFSLLTIVSFSYIFAFS